MSVLKPKSKMISIRLSDEEYEGLRTLCVSRGARSVSDLAREAMNRMLTNVPDVSPLEELRGRVDSLHERVELLVARIDGGK